MKMNKEERAICRTEQSLKCVKSKSFANPDTPTLEDDKIILNLAKECIKRRKTQKGKKYENENN